MATTKLYRCFRCAARGRDFAAAEPRCPKCGADQADAETPPNTIARLETIHFDPPHPDWPAGPDRPGKGTGKRACDGKPVNTPRKGEDVVGGKATGFADAVTCPACKESAEYKTASEDD